MFTDIFKKTYEELYKNLVNEAVEEEIKEEKETTDGEEETKFVINFTTSDKKLVDLFNKGFAKLIIASQEGDEEPVEDEFDFDSLNSVMVVQVPQDTPDPLPLDDEEQGEEEEEEQVSETEVQDENDGTEQDTDIEECGGTTKTVEGEGCCCGKKGCPSCKK